MAEKNLGALVVELLLKDAEFKSDLSKAASDFDVTGRRMQKTAMKLQSTATFAFKAIAGSIAAFGVTATIVGSKFEQQMAMVGAISGISQADEAFVMLEKHARKLGSTTEFTATQAAQALEELARGNISAADSLEYSAQALALAGTSGAGLAESTKLLIAVQNTFGLENTEVAHTTDVLSMAMRKSLFDFASLREAMKYGGIAGETFGYTLEETVAVMMKFKDLGLEGSMAGTQFRAALTMAGAQTRKQEKILQKYNLTLQDINPNLHKMKDILKTVGEAGISSTDVMKIFGRIAGGSVGILAQKAAVANDGIQENIELLQESSGAGKSVQSMYETIQETVSFQAKVALSALQELFLSTFDLFRGPLKDLLKAIPEVLNEMSRTIQAHSSSLKARFTQIFGEMEIFANKNSKMIADRFVGILYTALELGKGIKHLIDLFGFLINNAQVLAALIPTVFAVGLALKTASAVQAMAVAFGAANVSLQLFRTTVIITTGGLYAIVTAIGAVVAGLASYFLFFNNATEATDALRGATENLAKARDDARETLVQSLDAELKNAQALARVRLAQSNVTAEERERLENLLQLNAATAMSGIENGELVTVGKELISVKDLINKNEKAGVKIVDESIKATRKDISGLKVREATIRRQFDSYQRTTAAGSNSAAALMGLNAQLKGVLGTEAENIHQVEAAMNALVGEQEALTQKAIGLEQNKANTISAIRKKEMTAQKQSLAQQQQVQTQANQKRSKELEKLLNQAAKLEEKANLDFQKSTMSKEEFAAHQYMKQIEDAQALFDELARMYRNDEAKRKAIVARGNATINTMQDTFNQEQAKKNEQTEKENAQKKLEIQKKANEMLSSMTMTESQKLEKELSNILLELEDASLDTKDGIKDAYAELIDQARVAEGLPPKFARGFKGAILKVKAALNKMFSKPLEHIKKMIKTFSKIKAVVKDLTGKVTGVFGKLTGGFKIDPLGMAEDIQKAREEAEKEGLEFDLEATTRQMVTTAVESASQFLMTLVESLPVLIEEFVAQLPILITKVAEQLPVLVQTLVQNIPIIVDALIGSIPRFLGELIVGVIHLATALIAEIPRIVTALVLTVLSELPNIITALVAAIPQIAIAIIKEIPTIVLALISMIPVIAVSLVKAIFTELIMKLPVLIMAVLKGLVTALIEGLMAIGQAIGDIFRSKKGKERAKKRRADRTADNEAKSAAELESMLGESFGESSAFSGMSYVPATMRMTVHKGEAIVPADRAAQMRKGGPAAAGLEQNQNMSGSGGSSPIEISVIAEGRLLEAVQFKAEGRGHADKMSKAIRRASGAVIGFQRGKFNAWTS